MKTVAIASLAVLVALPALAGNARDWSGYYAGLHAGYQTGSEDWTLVDNPGDGESGSIGEVVTSQDVDGFIGGIQFGRNWQRGDIVWGIEAALSLSSLDGSSSRYSNGEKPGPRAWSTDTNWLATFGPRVGKAMDNNLFYVEGGLALANADYYHLGAKGGTPPGTGSEREYYGSATRYGAFIGAGIEHAFSDRWSGSLEYNYVAIGSGNAKLWGNPSEPAVFDIDQGAHTIRFSLNYHFR